jgi:hypothetical protein
MQQTALREDVLLKPIAELEQALKLEFIGHEQEWATAVGQALADLENALHLHTISAEAPDGLMGKVDLTRPTLVRQVGGLRSEHGALREQVQVLRAQLKRAARVFTPATGSVAQATALPEPTPTGGVPDFHALRQSALEFLTTLTRHRDEEAKLVFESINMDFGAGD